MRRHRQVVVAASLLFVPVLGKPFECHAQEGSTGGGSGGVVPEESWLRYADPEEAGWSVDGIEEALALADSLGSLSVMLVHEGIVVTAWGDLQGQENVASIAKPLQSAMVGIAVGRGEIDVASTLAELGVDDLLGLTRSERQASVRHLLTMSSGVYHPSSNEPAARPIPDRGSHAAGETFFYYNWNLGALNTIYETATGGHFPRDFLDEIATPLDFQDYGESNAGLLSNPGISEHANVLVRMSARDMARFGLLYLRNGRWGDRQIVPASWVQESREAHVEVGGGAHMGYYWWIPDGRLSDYGAYTASGAGNQLVTVVPDLELVFVHRAMPLGGGVSGLDAREILLRLIDARIGGGTEAPRLVPLD